MGSVHDSDLTPRPDARELADAFGLPDAADDPDCYDPETADPYDAADPDAGGAWGGHPAGTDADAEPTADALLAEFELSRDAWCRRWGYTRDEFEGFGRNGGDA